MKMQEIILFIHILELFHTLLYFFTITADFWSDYSVLYLRNYHISNKFSEGQKNTDKLENFMEAKIVCIFFALFHFVRGQEVGLKESTTLWLTLSVCTMFVHYALVKIEALESVMYDFIQIRLKRRDLTRSKIK